VANGEPGWKTNLQRELDQLDRRFRSYEQTPSLETRDKYETELGNLWNSHAQDLDIHGQAEREMLASNHGVPLERLTEPAHDFPEAPRFQAELTRLIELQEQRSQELERMCRDPLEEYDRRNGLTRDPNDRGR